METTRALVTQLVTTLCSQYAEQLTALPMKKNVRETLVDGFRDGCRSGANHALAMVGVEIK